MSLTLTTLQKCKNIHCNNERDRRTKKRFVRDFCKRCQSTDEPLFWKCARAECAKQIKGEIWSNKKYCSAYCRQAADYPNRNERWRNKRILEAIHKIHVCRMCKMKFKRLPKRKNEMMSYCSEYCKWLNHIKFTSHKKAIISVRQLE